MSLKYQKPERLKSIALQNSHSEFAWIKLQSVLNILKDILDAIKSETPKILLANKSEYQLFEINLTLRKLCGFYSIFQANFFHLLQLLLLLFYELLKAIYLNLKLILNSNLFLDFFVKINLLKDILLPIVL